MRDIFGKYILGMAVPIMLIGLGIFFLIYLRFFFLLKPKRTFSALFRSSKGSGTSGFGALTVALAGTLGVGNIVGVASSLILGGAGSLFWMWVSAFFAMVLKYAEIVLAHKHRKSTSTGAVGGAMYYIEDFFGKGMGRLLGAFFAILCLVNSLSMGCMLQSSAVSSSLSEISCASPFLVGAVLAVICGAVIFKGIHDISPLTSVVIPVMTLIYVSMSVIVIWHFRDGIGDVFSLIIKDAFSVKSVNGGLFGFLFSSQLRYGCMRGILSNEAGCGTAPIAHATSRAEKAAEQGVWGIVEVFVDTILLCTLTGISVLLAFGDDVAGFNMGEEMKLVIAAYGSAIGKSSAVLMTVMVFFFAFATIICWAYYGSVTLGYLTKSKNAQLIYRILYVACILLGSCGINGLVWQAADLALGCMTLINLTVLFLMRKEIKKETELLQGTFR